MQEVEQRRERLPRVGTRDKNQTGHFVARFHFYQYLSNLHYNSSRSLGL